MTPKRFFAGVYRFFTWPFRMIWRCFKKEEKKAEKIIRPVIKIPPIIPDHGIRVLRLDDDSPVVAHTKFKPLFFPDYFSEAKNDADFKKARKMARKREERIKCRQELMARLKKMDEEEGVKPKPKPPSPPSDPDSS